MVFITSSMMKSFVPLMIHGASLKVLARAAFSPLLWSCNPDRSPFLPLPFHALLFPTEKTASPSSHSDMLSPALSDGAFALCVRRVPVASQPCFGLVVLYECPALHVSFVSAFEHLSARCQYHHAQPVVLHHIVYIHSLPLVIYPLHFSCPFPPYSR